jgi:hypothetical protein
MVKREQMKRQTMLHKTLHNHHTRIMQHKTYKTGVNSCAPQESSGPPPAPYIPPVVLLILIIRWKAKKEESTGFVCDKRNVSVVIYDTDIP